MVKKVSSESKRDLMTNPSLNQFVTQDFPVIEESFDNVTIKRVKAIEYLSSHHAYECHSFIVEVVKDYNGYISFILHGYDNDNKDVWIMRTDDFNRAYELKNKLDRLLDGKPTDRMLMPCYGSLQRKKLDWEK